MAKNKIAENFAKCLPLLFDHEGGYSNDAHDPGGPTKWGITHIDLAAWLGRKVTTQDVKNISQDLAAKIYKAKYWTTVHGDDLPSGVDYMVFDYGVNSGNSRSAKALQKIVGVKVDGIIGGITLAAVNRADPIDVINKLAAQRLGFLQRLRTWIYFGKGWNRRVVQVKTNSLAWAKAAKENKPPVLVPLIPKDSPIVTSTPVVNITPKEENTSWFGWLFGDNTPKNDVKVPSEEKNKIKSNIKTKTKKPTVLKKSSVNIDPKMKVNKSHNRQVKVAKR